MSLIGGGKKSQGEVTTDGRGGFGSVDDNGVTTATGGDPVDNLINLAGQLADQDGDK